MTIKEIDKQIQELKNKRSELEKQERETFKQQAVNNVGRCFIVNNKRYVKVIGIPQEEWTVHGCHFNQYQYPALYIGYKPHNIVPFYEDTLFSAAWGVGNNMLDNDYKEISPEEFDAEFDRVLQVFTRKVKMVTL